MLIILPIFTDLILKFVFKARYKLNSEGKSSIKNNLRETQIQIQSQIILRNARPPE